MNLKPAIPVSYGNGPHLFRAAPTRSVCLVFALALLGAARLDAASGLTGQYYDTASFGTLKTTRTDATVNFDWGAAIPSGTALTSGDTFSVAWTGQLEPEFSQLYTFYVTADDGARLWVNDQLIVTRTFYAAPAEMRGRRCSQRGSASISASNSSSSPATPRRSWSGPAPRGLAK